MPNKIKFCVIEGRDVVKFPARAHSTDAGIDISTPNDFKSTVLNPNEQILVKTGLRVDVPENTMLMIANKSGISVKKQLSVGAGIIDQDYRGEIMINLFNRGNAPVIIKPNEKIAQGIIVPLMFNDVEMITEEVYNQKETDRGEGGFGSTGK